MRFVSKLFLIFFVSMLVPLAVAISDKAACEKSVSDQTTQMLTQNVADGDGNINHAEWGCSECAEAFQQCRQQLDTQWDTCVQQTGNGHQCSIDLEANYYACSNTEVNCCDPFIKQARCSGMSDTEPTAPVSTSKDQPDDWLTDERPQQNTEQECRDLGKYWLEGQCYDATGATNVCRWRYGAFTEATLVNGTAGCACMEGYVNPTGSQCEPAKAKDLCEHVVCDGKCDKSVGPQGRQNNYENAILSGQCNPTTGTCEYPDAIKCPAGCDTKQITGEKAVIGICNEECDNRKDDDGDGLVDCADDDCSKSLVCSCQQVASKTGSGRPLRVSIGGYEQTLPPTFIYTSKERDKEIIDDAKRILDALKKTPPFNNYGYTIYATRFATNALWAGDVITRCGGGDVTITIDYTSSGTSYARLRDHNSVTMYKFGNSDDEFGYIVLHELGHAIGGLWDEYDTGKEIGPAFGALNKALGSISILPTNCAVASNEMGCDNYFSQYKVEYRCHAGCNVAGWYRSSDTSIMRYVDASHQYNEVSKLLLNRELNAMVNPQPITLGAHYDVTPQPDLVR